MTRNVYYFEKSVAIFSHGSNQLLQSFERFKEHKRQWSGKMGRIINSSSAHTHTQKGLQIAIPRNGIKINDQKKCNVRGSRDEIMDLHLQLQRIRQKFYMITTHTHTHTSHHYKVCGRAHTHPKKVFGANLSWACRQHSNAINGNHWAYDDSASVRRNTWFWNLALLWAGAGRYLLHYQLDFFVWTQLISVFHSFSTSYSIYLTVFFATSHSLIEYLANIACYTGYAIDHLGVVPDISVKSVYIIAQRTPSNSFNG